MAKKEYLERMFSILGPLLLSYRDSALSSHISVYVDAGGRNQSLHKAGQSLPNRQPYLSYLMMGWGLYLYISTIRPLIAEFFS